MSHFFIADLDDTLLVDGVLPAGTLSDLRRIVDSGVHFTVATSRGLRAAVAPLADATPRLPIIALGGAVVAYADGSQPLIKRISPDAIEPIVRLAQDAGAPYCLLQTDGRDEIVLAPPRGDKFTDWSIDEAGYFKAKSILRGPSPIEAECSTIVRVTICATVASARRLARLIAETHATALASVVPSRDMEGFAWLEVGARTATKGHGVRYVASQLGVPIKNVVYYGDGIGDLEIMREIARSSGEAVAVANAHLAVLEVANRVIGEAGSGAVARDMVSRLGLEPLR